MTQSPIVASLQDSSRQPSLPTNSSTMVSIMTDHTYHMLSRHMGNGSEGPDFPLYPHPSAAMLQQQTSPFPQGQNFDLDNNSSYAFARAQTSYPTGFNSNAMYPEAASSYALESPELRAGAPSNYSTASGPSATSSAMGSPHSIHGHIAPGPEWPVHGLGLNPSIVGFDGSIHNGHEYNFASSGMEEFALDFKQAKPHGFVGKCKGHFISECHRHGLVSCPPKSPPICFNGLVAFLS